MKKYKLFILTLPLSILACKTEECKELSVVPQSACTAQYDPVCGCNQKTYSNACEAERVGIKTHTAGACKK